MKRVAVQGARLGIAAIADGVVSSVDGEHHAVLEATGTSNPFDDALRQEAVMAGFATFLNALSYPVQILVRASPIDLSSYVVAVEERGRHAGDQQLAELAHDHAMFVQQLARQRTLLERRFYLAVPAESALRTTWRSRLVARRGADQEPRREAARHQLTFRCDEVARQLNRCGVAVRRLADLELAQLYLACWGPERSRLQRFRQELDDYSTLAVGATPAAVVD